MLTEKIRSREANIGVIGLGYVGLPLALRFSKVGFKVTGFDIDESKANKLNSGRSYISHIPDELVEQAKRQHFVATTDFSEIVQLEAIIICVPTPLTADKQPDLQFIRSTVNSILPYLKENQLVSLESTSYPGTTREEIIAPLKKEDLIPGKNFHVVYSPEREDPGNTQYTLENIPKLVAGATSGCRDVGEQLYGAIVETPVTVDSLEIAECAKLLENIHRAVNIGLVNEMKIVTDAMDIDISKVIDAAATKPFGFAPYYPGPGLGGHCLPIDPVYLSWRASQFNVEAEFVRLAGEVNTNMPAWVVQKICSVLPGDPDGSQIVVLGAAYKKNVGDTRESPAIEIMNQLINLGAEVSYHDPLVAELPKMRRYNLTLQSQPLTEKLLTEADVIVLATDHDEFDYQYIEQFARIIVDTRRRFRDSPKVVAA